MIFKKYNNKFQECRFCGKPRYQPTGGSWPDTRPQQMWYLQIIDRLKRVYQPQRTSVAMRCHAQHSAANGEVTHPPDAKAYKHFQTVHLIFANECRNVYLAVCTYMFIPFDMYGRLSSL